MKYSSSNTKYLSIDDIIKSAEKTYALPHYAKTEDEYKRFYKKISRMLKNPPFDYHNGFKGKIRPQDIELLVNYKLHDYFLPYSKDPRIEKNEKIDAKLRKKATELDLSLSKNPENINLPASNKSLAKVLDEITDQTFDPIRELKYIGSKDDDYYFQLLNDLDKRLKQVKNEFIFRTLLKSPSERKSKIFMQKEYIKDYFNRDFLLDDRYVIPRPLNGYSYYNQKLNNPLKYYFKDKD